MFLNTIIANCIHHHTMCQPLITRIKENTTELLATLLAIGLDPEKSSLFVQSDVGISTELAWILQCLAPMGHMERMIQFKEKSEDNPNHVNVGLFSYPILQTADIL